VASLPKPDPAIVNLEVTRGALDAAIVAAARVDPVIAGPNGQRHAIVPDGFTLAELKDPYALSPWPVQAVIVDNRASLSAYVNRFSDPRTVLIADIDAGTISARIDYHEAEGGLSGPCRHSCTLKMRDSEEFRRWNAIAGKLKPQADFAAFLEENACDVIDPEPAVLIEISRDLEAVQNVSFRASNRLENGDRAFVYETETKTKGEVRIPREFTLQIPLYDGEEPVQITCAFRYRIEAGGLLLGFEWRRVEYQRRAVFGQVATQASEDTGAPVYFGRTGHRAEILLPTARKASLPFLLPGSGADHPRKASP
jgi:uncharacterized protein YfdQ (DUF2303 family)